MLISNESALKRLTSPGNLMNKLKCESNRKNAMSLFIKPSITQESEMIETIETIEDIKDKTNFNPFVESKSLSAESLQPQSQQKQDNLQPEGLLDDIMNNHDSQIKLGLAHDKSLTLLTRSVDMLSEKLDDIKADKLPSVIAAASKVVEGIRKERAEQSKSGKDKEVHYHFYTPTQKPISEYEIIDIGSPVSSGA